MHKTTDITIKEIETCPIDDHNTVGVAIMFTLQPELIESGCSNSINVPMYNNLLGLYL